LYPAKILDLSAKLFFHITTLLSNL